MTVFGTYQGASTIMRRAFDWKRSRISMSDGSHTPQLEFIGPYWFEDRSVYENVAAAGDCKHERHLLSHCLYDCCLLSRKVAHPTDLH
jgi:hypothetical protein